jgi:hypothetical protein
VSKASVAFPITLYPPETKALGLPPKVSSTSVPLLAEMIEEETSVLVATPSSKLSMPLPLGAVWSVMVLNSMTVRPLRLRMPPTAAVLPEMVEFVILRVPPLLEMPPAKFTDVLLLTVEPSRFSVAPTPNSYGELDVTN